MQTVTANINFRVSANNPAISEPTSLLPGVSILLIGTDGKIIDELVTNEQGEVQKDITVPIDHKYLDESQVHYHQEAPLQQLPLKKAIGQKSYMKYP